MQTTKAAPPDPTSGDSGVLTLPGWLSSALGRERPHFAAIAPFILPVHGAFPSRGNES